MARHWPSESLIPQTRVCGALNISAMTFWRWRVRGWIHVLRVGQRVFVTRGEYRRFLARARRGDFATGCNLSRSATL
jgi:hypothetical protein